MRIISTLAMLLALTACEYIKPSDTRLHAIGWADRGERLPEPQAAYWCYRTLGRPDCSATPLPGQEYRLIEGGPAPLPPQTQAMVEAPPVAPAATAVTATAMAAPPMAPPAPAPALVKPVPSPKPAAKK